tara:strand:- start:571 stop:1158 length:588 start_codon:yes stop_codon:yes gene_type:complete
MGNLGSVSNMLKYLGIEARIESDPDKIYESSKLILPGVGAFDEAMNNINKSGIRQALDDLVINKKIPVLGICLGMQLLTNESEEGKQEGLSYIPAKTKKFRLDKNFKVPHMGWNYLSKISTHKLTDGLNKDNKFYFVHSYHVEVEDDKYSLLKTKYGEEFDSAISSGHIAGVQFHPEKSHRNGMQILKNFSKIEC